MDRSLKYYHTGLDKKIDCRLASLILSPDAPHYDDLLVQLIKSSHFLPKKVSESFNPLYIIDISSKHPMLRSLTIDYHGDTWVSCQTSDWVAEAVFSHLGFKYRFWSEFLRTINKSPRTTYPYVNGNIVYLRFCQAKQSNWLNVSKCTHIDSPTLSADDSAPKQDFFHFTFNFSDDSMRKCMISLKQPTTKLIKQLEYANHLCSQWVYYFTTSLPQLHLNFHVNFDSFQNRQVFPNSHFANPSLCLISPRQIKDFIAYSYVCEHLNTLPGHSQSKELNKLYTQKGIDSLTLRNALANYGQ